MKIKSLTLTLIFLLASSACFAQYDCGSFEDCLNVGVAAYQEENYEGAIGYLTNAVFKFDRKVIAGELPTEGLAGGLPACYAPTAIYYL